MPGAAIRKSANEFGAKAAKAACNDLDARIGERERRYLLARQMRLRRVQDDLADVSGLLHQPERIHRALRRKGPVRQREECLFLEQGHHPRQKPFGQARLVGQELVRVDAEIAQVPAERPESQVTVLVIIALAKLEEAAERLQQFDATLHGLSEQRVENNVHAFAVCEVHHLVGKVQRTGIQDIVGTERRKKRAFLGRAGGCDHPCPRIAGDLKRCEPDASGSTVHEHRIALSDPGQFHKRVVGREEGDRNGCRRFRRE